MIPFILCNKHVERDSQRIYVWSWKFQWESAQTLVWKLGWWNLMYFYPLPHVVCMKKKKQQLTARPPPALVTAHSIWAHISSISQRNSRMQAFTCVALIYVFLFCFFAFWYMRQVWSILWQCLMLLLAGVCASDQHGTNKVLWSSAQQRPTANPFDSTFKFYCFAMLLLLRNIYIKK